MSAGYLATLVAATALAAAAGHRIRWLLTASIIASSLLALAAVTRPTIFDEPQWLVFAVYTVALKCLVLPRPLREVRASHQPPQEPRRSALGLATAGALAAVGYATTAASSEPAILGSALATALVGVHIAVSRTDPMARVLGVAILANGAPLALLAVPSPGLGAFTVLGAIDVGIVALVLALRHGATAAALTDGGSALR